MSPSADFLNEPLENPIPMATLGYQIPYGDMDISLSLMSTLHIFL